MTRQELESAIAELEAAKRSRLLGRTRTAASSDEGSVTYQLATMAEIDQELVRLRLQLSKLTGAPSGLGPVRAAFRS